MLSLRLSVLAFGLCNNLNGANIILHEAKGKVYVILYVHRPIFVQIRRNLFSRILEA